MFVQWNAPFHPTSRWLFCSGESETERVGVRAMDVIFCFSPFGLSGFQLCCLGFGFLWDFFQKVITGCYSLTVSSQMFPPPRHSFLMPWFQFGSRPRCLLRCIDFLLGLEETFFLKNWWINKQSLTGCLWCINLKSVASQLPTSLAAFHPLHCRFPPSNQCCPLSAPSFQASLPKKPFVDWLQTFLAWWRDPFSEGGAFSLSAKPRDVKFC